MIFEPVTIRGHNLIILHNKLNKMYEVGAKSTYGQET